MKSMRGELVASAEIMPELHRCRPICELHQLSSHRGMNKAASCDELGDDPSSKFSFFFICG
jgi:hypothetical protein